MAARRTAGALRARYDTRRPVKDIAAALGRSPDAVTARRRQLGIAPRHQAWTAREDALLRAAAVSGIPATWVASRLSRTPDAVRWRQRALVGRRAGAAPYTPDEDEAIRRCFARGDDVAALARRLGRSAAAVRRHAETLGAYHPRRRARWSVAEDAIVRDGYADLKTCATSRAGFPAVRVSASAPMRPRRSRTSSIRRVEIEASVRLASESSSTSTLRASTSSPERLRPPKRYGRATDRFRACP